MAAALANFLLAAANISELAAVNRALTGPAPWHRLIIAGPAEVLNAIVGLPPGILLAVQLVEAAVAEKIAEGVIDAPDGTPKIMGMPYYKAAHTALERVVEHANTRITVAEIAQVADAYWLMMPNGVAVRAALNSALLL